MCSRFGYLGENGVCHLLSRPSRPVTTSRLELSRRRLRASGLPGRGRECRRVMVRPASAAALAADAREAAGEAVEETASDVVRGSTSVSVFASAALG